MLLQRVIYAGLILMILFSCKESKIENKQSKSGVNIQKTSPDSLSTKLKHNLHFIGDSLLGNKAALIEKLARHYQSDSCGVVAYEDSDLRRGYEGYKLVGSLNGDKSPDTVFVMPPFNHCDDGYSYYFVNPELPRLYTDSYCCHPDNLFSIGDIDEDGIKEICIFYSSCASRFKSLIAYSLKNNQWKQIGRCTFDIIFMQPLKESRVRKTGKGKFEMLEIVDKEENKKWKQFSF